MSKKQRYTAKNGRTFDLAKHTLLSTRCLVRLLNKYERQIDTLTRQIEFLKAKHSNKIVIIDECQSGFVVETMREKVNAYLNKNGVYPIKIVITHEILDKLTAETNDVFFSNHAGSIPMMFEGINIQVMELGQ